MTKCKGMNCTVDTFDGKKDQHSLECHAEHAAAIAGGYFVKEKPADAQLIREAADYISGEPKSPLIADQLRALSDWLDAKRGLIYTCSCEAYQARIAELEAQLAEYKADAERYQRARILGVVINAETPLLRFTNLDAHLDADIKLHPPRGEFKGGERMADALRSQQKRIEELESRFIPDWANYRQGLKDGAAEAEAKLSAIRQALPQNGAVSAIALAHFHSVVASIFEDAPAQQPASTSDNALQNNEQYRMQMAGISTATSGYWREGESVHPDYDTPALRDVAKLYAKYDEPFKAASTSAQVPEALQTFEGYSAIRQAHEIVKSDEYFNARFDGLDTRDRRNVFLAGFNSGFDARHMLNQPAPAGNQPQEG